MTSVMCWGLTTYSIYYNKFLIILAYAFERVVSMTCAPGDEGDTLESTKDKCKNNYNNDCIGVFQSKCSNAEDSYLCFKNATILSQVHTEGCFFKKFAIGE